MADQLRDVGVGAVGGLELLGLKARVDAVEAVAVEEGEALLTVLVLVLEEGDLVAVAGSVEVGEKGLVEQVVVGPAGEDRVVDDDRVEAQVREIPREAVVGVDRDDGEARVAAKGIDVVGDRRRVREERRAVVEEQCPACVLRVGGD